MSEEIKFGGKSVTVTLSAANHFRKPIEETLPKKDELVKLFGKKRIVAKVKKVTKDEPYSHKFTMKLGYKASPKSQLRPKSIFSKNKYEIF